MDKLWAEEQERKRRERAKRRAQRRQSKQSQRPFPSDNGTVGGQPAYVQQSGGRTVGYFGRDHEGKIVSNDGLNADYLRDDEGNVSIDHREGSTKDPYGGRNRFD